LFLLACLPLLYGQKTRAGQEPPTTAKPGVDYPIKVHISGIRIRTNPNCIPGSCDDLLHADAVLNQQKIVLTGDLIYIQGSSQDNPVPGDYSARLLKIVRKGRAVPLYYEYELLLPDWHVWRCMVTGIDE
jgi:hypothetical protein